MVNMALRIMVEWVGDPARVRGTGGFKILTLPKIPIFVVKRKDAPAVIAWD